MKQKIQQILLAVLFGLGVPGMILAVSAGAPSQRLEATRPDSTTPAASEPEQSPDGTPDGTPVQLILPQGTVELTLEDYLVGVLLRELPRDFHMEAKKAQAIAARTYTLRAISRGGKHPEGCICADSSCCQAYLSPESYLEGGGTAEGVLQARQAVRETAGQVIVYDGKLIDATYFSCSGGKTEDALAVWGGEVPYLQSVESPGEEGATHFTDTVQLSAAEFYETLGLELEGSPAAWLGKATYTQGGGVEEITIGGVSFTGTQMRQRLGLRSTAFTITAVGDTVTITTRGFGHRVGLSQYGAQAMAQSGSDCRQILAHYYTGTTVVDYSQLLAASEETG